MATDVQHFDSSGTWRKPAGAGRVEVTLQGAPGGPPLPGGVGGRGGDPTVAMGFSMAAGGGGGAGATSHPSGDVAAAGGPGGTARAVFDAAALPGEVPISVGAGGFAHVVTYLDGDGGRPG